MILSRAPLSAPKGAACDLHALGTPPAFVLSQDQTLRYMVWKAPEEATAPNGIETGHVCIITIQL